jgi:acetyl esterase
MASLFDRVPARVITVAARLLFGLPAPIKRLLAGRPLRRDGLELDLDMQLLLRLLSTDREATLHADDVATARAKLERAAPAGNGPVIRGVPARELTIPSDAGPIAARLYTPAGAPDRTPLLVFYHGGGWVLGSIDTHDNTCRFLAVEAGVRVLSVDYRLAPEHPFPAAVQDAVTAFRFAVAHAAELGVDADAIAVGGDSAGGNLAAAVCHVAAAEGGPRPNFALLFYPGTDASVRRPSRDLFGVGFSLTDVDIDWFLTQYIPDRALWSDPRFSVLGGERLADFPPVYLTVGGFDPLRDEVEDFGARLAAAGVPVVVHRHSGLLHGFVNYLGISARSREAVAAAAGALRTGLTLAKTPAKPVATTAKRTRRPPKPKAG